MNLPTLPYDDADICHVGVEVDAAGWYLTVCRDGNRPVPAGRGFGSKEAAQEVAVALRKRIRPVRRIMGRSVEALAV